MTWPNMPYSGGEKRGIGATRILKMMIMMNDRAYTIREMASRLGVSMRTVRRDIRVIESIGAPIYCEAHEAEEAIAERNAWRLQRHWLQRFL